MTLAQDISRLLRKNGFQAAQRHHSSMVRGYSTVIRSGYELRTETIGSRRAPERVVLLSYTPGRNEPDRTEEIAKLLAEHGFRLNGQFVERT